MTRTGSWLVGFMCGCLVATSACLASIALETRAQNRRKS